MDLERKPQQESVAFEAIKLCYGDREQSYGHPYVDFERATKMFEHASGVKLTPSQGATFMACLKLARQAHAPKRDNLVDLCGYAIVIDECLDVESKVKE